MLGECFPEFIWIVWWPRLILLTAHLIDGQGGHGGEWYRELIVFEANIKSQFYGWKTIGCEHRLYRRLAIN